MTFVIHELQTAARREYFLLNPAGSAGLTLVCVRARLPRSLRRLMFAAAGGQTEIVRMLINAKCDLDQATEFDDSDADIGGETALHLAAYHGHTEILSMLLRNGAEPNMSMRNGRTALIIASEQGRGDVTRMLLEHGCNVHAVTNSGKTALYSACENGHAHIVPALLDHGSDVNQVRQRWWTCCGPCGMPVWFRRHFSHIACCCCCRFCCVTDQATRRNKIPLYVAAEKGYVDIARILLSRAGASDPFVRTKYGTTPMFIASKTSNQKMKALLMEFCKPGKKEGGAAKAPKKKRKAKGAGGDSDVEEEVAAALGGVEESKFSDTPPMLPPALSSPIDSSLGGAVSATCPVHGTGAPPAGGSSAPSSPNRGGSVPPRATSPRSPRPSSSSGRCTCPDPAVAAVMAQREQYLAYQRAQQEAQQRRQEEWRARQRQRQRQVRCLACLGENSGLVCSY